MMGTAFKTLTQLPQVLDAIVELMVDPFGNYLIQKLLDRCSEQQRLEVCAPALLSRLPTLFCKRVVVHNKKRQE